jgi:hypothetical protein
LRDIAIDCPCNAPIGRELTLVAIPRRKPVEYPRPNSYSPGAFAEQNTFGTCENEDCEWEARSTCGQCGGQYCLRHGPHARHDD